MAQETTITVASSRQGREFVDPEKLALALKSLVALYEKIDANTWSVHQPRLEWGITKATTNSPLQMTLLGEMMPQLVAAGVEEPPIPRNTLSGLRKLATASTRPPGFDDDAIRLARDLNKVALDLRMKIEVPGEEPYTPDPRVTLHADEVLAKAPPRKPPTYGYVQGIIRQLTIDEREGHEKSEFVIIDRTTGDYITCLFRPEIAEEIGGNVRHRIIVSGTIYYDGSKPNRIAVERHRFLKDESDLPTLSDLQRLGLVISGDDDAADFINDLRNPSE